MGESNGSNEYATGNPLVDAAFQRLQARNDARFRDLEDAMVVQGHLEKKMGERIRAHAELMGEFDDKLNAERKRLDQLWERTDKRIADLVTSIGQLISRLP